METFYRSSNHVEYMHIYFLLLMILWLQYCIFKYIHTVYVFCYEVILNDSLYKVRKFVSKDTWCLDAVASSPLVLFFLSITQNHAKFLSSQLLIVIFTFLMIVIVTVNIVKLIILMCFNVLCKFERAWKLFCIFVYSDERIIDIYK